MQANEHHQQKSETITQVMELLNTLSDEERYFVFNMYCTECGSNELPCYCENDE